MAVVGCSVGGHGLGDDEMGSSNFALKMMWL